ncbi:hypothetical protein [Sphingomonas sp. ABOLF]|uniref:hypothetical protein n=1 Tax=Sphingomonas sp. ABOLF TaxID=1985879 RepID=UPI000F7EF300|nr:hypothetical protein [Sphingomonas sp. ABOLF]
MTRADELLACEDLRSVYFDPDDVVRPDQNTAPWPKACEQCAFLAHDPQHLGAEVRALLRSDVADGEVDFFCVHRTTKRGCHRVCASAAAIRTRALAAIETGAAA